MPQLQAAMDKYLPASDRVALGRYRPRAPTDPYVLTLEHTVLQIMAFCVWEGGTRGTHRGQRVALE